jgi:hypothetical protein
MIEMEKQASNEKSLRSGFLDVGKPLWDANSTVGQ